MHLVGRNTADKSRFYEILNSRSSRTHSLGLSAPNLACKTTCIVHSSRQIFTMIVTCVAPARRNTGHNAALVDQILTLGSLYPPHFGHQDQIWRATMYPGLNFFSPNFAHTVAPARRKATLLPRYLTKC